VSGMKTCLPEILRYRLIRTTRRLTFDIDFQAPRTIYTGDDDGEYYRFVASNKYEVISRSRMDIQTERIWLLGAKHNEEPRSGSMVFSSDQKAFNAHVEFIKALDEWAAHYSGRATRIS
jgi:secreted PhoX family phosphatase